MGKKVEFKTLAELEAMHTGSLMKRRDALLQCTERPDRENAAASVGTGPIEFKDSPQWRQAYSDLKQVLDRREHLPNKQERKALRQARAKKSR